MTVKEIADRYYEAYASRGGDMSEVPLAEDFRFRGPVASFDDAEGFRGMALNAGQMIESFNVRHQFVDGNRVCSIIECEVSLPIPTMVSAEVLEVEDGKLVSADLIYDAQELRAAMAQAG